MAESRKSPSPRGLQASGKRLWRSVVDDFDLEEHELLTLREACRVADRLDLLAEALDDSPLTVTNAKGDEVASPYLVESRQQATVYTRLIASLRIPDSEGAQPQRRGAARGAYDKPLRAVQ